MHKDSHYLQNKNSAFTVQDHYKPPRRRHIPVAEATIYKLQQRK